MPEVIGYSFRELAFGTTGTGISSRCGAETSGFSYNRAVCDGFSEALLTAGCDLQGRYRSRNRASLSGFYGVLTNVSGALGTSDRAAPARLSPATRWSAVSAGGPITNNDQEVLYAHFRGTRAAALTERTCVFIVRVRDDRVPEIMSRADPLVSVVIPTYGRSETLVEAVRSVIDQTYDNIELLVVDDGSPVPVEEQVSKLPLGSLSAAECIRHDENRGANVARNSGIDAASGHYVAFLDDDDRWEESKISRQVATFRDADPDTGVVYTGLRMERPDGTVVRTPQWRGDVVKDLLAGRNFGQFSSLMVRADVIEAAGPPDERFPIWQDREWFFRLAQHCWFEPVAEPLTIRQTGHDDQISGNFKAKRDVAYPLFVEKHRPLAAEYGIRYEWLFLATLRYSLAKTAVRCQRYSEARKYFLLAFLAYPTYQRSLVYLLATAGGELTYSLARGLNDRIPRLREAIGSNVSN